MLNLYLTALLCIVGKVFFRGSRTAFIILPHIAAPVFQVSPSVCAWRCQHLAHRGTQHVSSEDAPNCRVRWRNEEQENLRIHL